MKENFIKIFNIIFDGLISCCYLYTGIQLLENEQYLETIPLLLMGLIALFQNFIPAMKVTDVKIFWLIFIFLPFIYLIFLIPFELKSFVLYLILGLTLSIYQKFSNQDKGSKLSQS
jgi:hypothetical protein